MVRACHSPTFARTSASAAASASTAPIININDSPGYGDSASPLETGDIKRDFIVLYSGSSQTCNKKYNKEAKIDIFYDILPVEDSILLGDSPPPNLKKVCTSYCENSTRLFMTWPSIFKIVRNGIYVLFVIPRLELYSSCMNTSQERSLGRRQSDSHGWIGHVKARLRPRLLGLLPLTSSMTKLWYVFTIIVFRVIVLLLTVNSFFSSQLLLCQRLRNLIALIVIMRAPS